MEKGELHEHTEQHEAMKKDLHYRRFLWEHHKGNHDKD
jgi:hypothetical protein